MLKGAYEVAVLASLAVSPQNFELEFNYSNTPYKQKVFGVISKTLVHYSTSLYLRPFDPYFKEHLKKYFQLIISSYNLCSSD